VKKLLIAAAAVLIISPASATSYNVTFDCGNGRSVTIANPAVGHGEDRKREVIFTIEISKFNFDNGSIRSPVVLWNVDKDRVTMDGKVCHEVKDEEGEKK
jgi:hypothetical protein